jgi:hypothetical protein
MRTGQHAFEMVEAVEVGHGIAAILKHDPDAGDTGPGARIDAAAAIDDPSRDRHPVEYGLAANANQGVGATKIVPFIDSWIEQ